MSLPESYDSEFWRIIDGVFWQDEQAAMEEYARKQEDATGAGRVNAGLERLARDIGWTRTEDGLYEPPDYDHDDDDDGA